MQSVPLRLFVMQRNWDWGVPGHRISVVENLRDVAAGNAPLRRVWDGLLRLGYCG